MIFVTAILIAIFGLSGCRSFGPNRMESDRFDYNTAVSKSLQTQVLLNIVRLRYSEWPTFLDVEQIVAQYTWEHTGTAKGLFRIGEYEQGELGYVGKYSERPVVLYKPMKGSKFMKSMLTPAPAGALLGLIYTGWPADKMFEIMVHSVNGNRNTQVERNAQLHPSVGFAKFIEVLGKFQRRDALNIDVASRKRVDSDHEAVETYLGFSVSRVDDELRKELDEAKKLIGLSTETNRYKVIWGSISPNKNIIAMETRSVLQLMATLSSYVEVPEIEVEEGRLTKLRPIPKENISGLKPLMDICRGDTAPPDAYASCKYRGKYFWIADTDINSKNTFTYLTLLLTLGDTDSSGGAALVITTN